MSTITARLHFSFPYECAAEYLREGLVPSARTGVQEVLLTAHIPATPIDLSKNVLVTCSKEPGEDGCWNIGWIPEPGGIYPTFEGKLRAYPSSRRATILELSGSYKPPLGIAGEAFDRVLGRTITAETAHEFLANIAGEIKVRYALEEAREIFREVESPDETIAQP